MAANPQTGIDPEVDRFAVVRLSDGVIINPNSIWPRVDGGPIVGGNPDIAYFKRVLSDAPPVDHRFTTQTTWTVIDADPLPAEGYPRGTYEQSHAAVKLPNADLKIQVETKFQDIVQAWFPSQNDPAVLVEAADALVRKGNNAALTEAQQTTLDNINAIGVAMAANRARQAELIAAIDADQDYDIEEGWTLPQ